jgi:hypothetical protein
VKLSAVKQVRRCCKYVLRHFRKQVSARAKHVDISPGVNVGDSHPREWALLFHRLIVSRMPLQPYARAFTSTVFSFPKPQGTSQSVRHHLHGSFKWQKKESVYSGQTRECFYARERCAAKPPKHSSVVNVPLFSSLTTYQKRQHKERSVHVLPMRKRRGLPCMNE